MNTINKTNINIKQSLSKFQNCQEWFFIFKNIIGWLAIIAILVIFIFNLQIYLTILNRRNRSILRLANILMFFTLFLFVYIVLIIQSFLVKNDFHNLQNTIINFQSLMLAYNVFFLTRQISLYTNVIEIIGVPEQVKLFLIWKLVRIFIIIITSWIIFLQFTLIILKPIINDYRKMNDLTINSKYDDQQNRLAPQQKIKNY